MIVRKILDWRIIIRRTWKRVFSVLVVSLIIALLHRHYNYKDIAFPTTPAAILGVAISFLIGFRVNSAYERWWEARKAWGAIVNDSRSAARQISTFFKNEGVNSLDGMQRLQKEMLLRVIAFPYALKALLRKQDPLAGLHEFIGADELNELGSKRHIPNSILLRQAECLKEARDKAYLDDFRHMQIDFKISALCDSMGVCERIKNTIFPRQYAYYSTLFVAIYSYMIPFTLVEDAGFMVIPFSMIIAFIFYALDGIASGIENPFENSINDTPMNAICRNIEISIKEMMGEKELPPVVEPQNGFLY